MHKNNDYMLALDIGTRTVIGLLCRLADTGEVVVEHYQVEWHPQRAMLDGQIHDVSQVSAVLERVKQALETKTGSPLTGAAVAAAGRALTTLRVSETIEFDDPKEIDGADRQRLEVKALVQAREAMARKGADLYCVGFSPVAYYLDKLSIANPLGQRGSSLGVEIIATFLPRMVVDSLYSAVNKAGLSVESLTLEPIAAMAVAVPPRLRLLNLALVDIGAGTSDVAVSREGTIVSYGMVDMAGDEVTEAIAQHYLLDFNSAERVKILLGRHEVIEFTDVLGNDCQESRESILAVIDPVVDKLARNLSAEIKHNNGGFSPLALFCVGGGSLTPTLRERLAKYLDLPLERIGIRTREHLEGVRFNSEELKGPEIVTPLGIALTAVKPRQDNFLRIVLNGQEVTIFKVQKATVGQALMHCGIDASAGADADLDLVFEFNGETRVVKGQRGQGSEISVNDIAATLDTPLLSGDRVDVAPGVPGSLPKVTLGELAAEQTTSQFNIDGSVLEVPLLQKINGLLSRPDVLIQTGDIVKIGPPQSVGELATLMDLDLESVAIAVNGVAAAWDTPLPAQASITLSKKRTEPASPRTDEISVTVNGQKLTLPKERSMLAYALAQADIRHTGAAKGNLAITINGRAADYTTLLNTGDRIEVFWGPKL